MKFKHIKASEWSVERRHHDTENGEDYYYIWGPDGEYCDADGEPYHFDSREDALEELEYLRAEHKGDEKSKKVTSRKNYILQYSFDGKFNNPQEKYFNSLEELSEYLKNDGMLSKELKTDNDIKLFNKNNEDGIYRIIRASKKVKSSYGYDTFDEVLEMQIKYLKSIKAEAERYLALCEETMREIEAGNIENNIDDFSMKGQVESLEKLVDIDIDLSNAFED